MMEMPVPTQAFWNYETAQARFVRVIVGPCERETFWHNGLEGTEREAVEVTYHGEVFYLDNEGHKPGWEGSGWSKVTWGRGGPEYGHSSLPVAKVLDEVPLNESPFIATMMQRMRDERAARMKADIDEIKTRHAPPRREDYPSRQSYRHAMRKGKP